MPRLDRVSELEAHVPRLQRTDDRAAVLEERSVSFARNREPRLLEVREDVLEVAPQPCRQKEPIVEPLPPANERRAVRRAGERRDERSDERHLGHGHPHVGRHLEGAQLDDPLAPMGGRRIEQLVDADLGAVRIAGDVDQQMPKQRITKPRWRRLAPRFKCRARGRSPARRGRRAALRRGAAPAT